MSVNINQVIGVLRIVIPVMLSYAVAKGWLPESSVATVTAAIITLLSAGWSFKGNSPAAVVKQAATLDDVKEIVVKPTAAKELTDAAADPAQPKITGS